MWKVELTLRIGEGKRYFCSHSPESISHIQTLLSVEALNNLNPLRDQLKNTVQI